MAQALINAGQPEEARRWCEEALAVARAVGSADDEADVLITLGLIEAVRRPCQGPLAVCGGPSAGG